MRKLILPIAVIISLLLITLVCWKKNEAEASIQANIKILLTAP